MSGRARILVVEDEPIVAMCLEDMLDALGHDTIGPASRLADGLALADIVEAEAAILDINLSGERSDAIAERLRTRGIPLVFATGYGAPPQGFPDAPLLEKPYRLEQVEAALAAIGIGC